MAAFSEKKVDMVIGPHITKHSFSRLSKALCFSDDEKIKLHTSVRALTVVS